MRSVDPLPFFNLNHHKRPERKLSGFWARVSDCAFNALSGDGCHSLEADPEKTKGTRLTLPLNGAK